MSTADSDNSIRISKFLATHSGISRRQADGLIEKRQVSINGQIAEIGGRYNPGDRVEVNGQLVKSRNQATTILFNKPIGYVCSRRRQGDYPTIYSLLPDGLHRLKPIGRLDRDTSGLLLLSDDGDLAHRLTHPKFHKQKAYQVELDSDLSPLHRQMINDYGIQLEDGLSQLTLTRQTDGNDRIWQISMHEGRNRQIRRTFVALGYQVVKLHRSEFGNYSLGDISPGEYVSIDIS